MQHLKPTAELEELVERNTMPMHAMMPSAMLA